MNNIELTEEHKSKLLEMCNKLFWKGCINKNDFRENNILLIAIDKNYKYNHKILTIHWFEFCCKNLAFQIYNFNIGKTKTTYSTFVGECVITSIFHPVDYLYKEFKNIKNE